MKKSDSLKAFFGISSTKLTPQERSFFKKFPPLGFILFSRNIQDEEQVLQLTQELKTLSNRQDVPILIDEEGGRVSRLSGLKATWKTPCMEEIVGESVFSAQVNPVFDPSLKEVAFNKKNFSSDLAFFLEKSNAFGQSQAFWQKELEEAWQRVYAHYQAIGKRMKDLGISVNCAPVLDIAHPQTAGFLKSRCLGSDPWVVSFLGQACIQALLDTHIKPVIKHAPGHGLAQEDSHLTLPVVLDSEEEINRQLTPFHVNLLHFPETWVMTAHLNMPALACSTTTYCRKMISRIRHISQEKIFQGLIMTDDLFMGALHKDPLHQRISLALEAGHDGVLICSGAPEDWEPCFS